MTLLTNDEAETRVARGARFLDAMHPGWHERINPMTLELSECTRCVLGQLCGNFWEGTGREWGLSSSHIWQPLDTAVLFGFALAQREAQLSDDDWLDYINNVRARYQPLQDAWITAIAARKFPTVEPARHPADAEATSTNAVREDTDQPLVALRGSRSS